MDIPASILAEFDAILATPPTTQIEEQDPAPGKWVRLLRETRWENIVPPWFSLLALIPIREPVIQRIINIKEALSLRDYLETRLRQREAFLAQAVGDKVTPQCEQCAQGKGQFVGCIVVPGMLHGACANCVWEKPRSRKGQCSFLVIKENKEDAHRLEHERKVQKGDDQSIFCEWGLSSTQ
ncbi:uncharacterized protein N7482_008711 [Penicillium canariense]|uniref:Uncharacterized protein n=1 Tax=Penicillium canariense TaxID=189055 RepID=A0A9W9HX41_9EURO|nr:uncharacterized protein N7482_008711 [Penicillium canariense]KAJ5157611.1 hypothetical protein N7482_008711 [Penicillium canariense]